MSEIIKGPTIDPETVDQNTPSSEQTTQKSKSNCLVKYPHGSERWALSINGCTQKPISEDTWRIRRYMFRDTRDGRR